MSHADGKPGQTDATQILVEELLRTAFSLGGAFVSLLDDLPEDAFPGEDPSAVLIEMVSGTCRPVVEAAGESACWAAASLIGAVRDRVIDDLRAAAELARRGQ